MKLRLAITLLFLPVFSAFAEKVPEGFLLLHRDDYQPPANSKVSKALNMKMSSENLRLTMGELELKGSLAMISEETVSGVQITPDKARYLMTESSTRNTITLAGKEQVKPDKEEPLLKVPVILERADEKWSARLEKGKATKAQEKALAKLEDEWNTDDDEAMYGTKPRRIGEQWEVDAADVPGFKGAADGVKGKVTLKLVGEKVVDGERFGQVRGKIDAVMLIKGKEGDDPDTKIGLKGEIEVLRSLKHYADSEMEMKGEMTMTVDAPGPDGPMKMTASGPFVFTGKLDFK